MVESAGSTSPFVPGGRRPSPAPAALLSRTRRARAGPRSTLRTARRVGERDLKRAGARHAVRGGVVRGWRRGRSRARPWLGEHGGRDREAAEGDLVLMMVLVEVECNRESCSESSLSLARARRVGPGGLGCGRTFSSLATVLSCSSEDRECTATASPDSVRATGLVDRASGQLPSLRLARSRSTELQVTMRTWSLHRGRQQGETTTTRVQAGRQGRGGRARRGVTGPWRRRRRSMPWCPTRRPTCRRGARAGPL